MYVNRNFPYENLDFFMPNHSSIIFSLIWKINTFDDQIFQQKNKCFVLFQSHCLPQYRSQYFNTTPTISDLYSMIFLYYELRMLTSRRVVREVQNTHRPACATSDRLVVNRKKYDLESQEENNLLSFWWYPLWRLYRWCCRPWVSDDVSLRFSLAKTSDHPSDSRNGLTWLPCQLSEIETLILKSNNHLYSIL